ncbi:MAG: sugar phosphate nucleotidyltransferase, partial [Candidatus Njordarchaeota archaeon]
MNAIILAAGIGKRLRPLTTDKPKTLINLDGKTILEYICCNLASVEIRKAYVVLGHAKEKVIEYAKYIEKKLGMRFVFVENRIFEQSNTGYSLLLALERLKETQNDVIIVNGDIIFDFKILLRLIKRENTA